MALRGGILIGVNDGALVFVAADRALRLAPISALTPVEGLRPPAIGIAIAEGRLVTALDLAGAVSAGLVAAAPPLAPDSRRRRWERPEPGADRPVLCDVGGQLVALCGGLVIATGVFEEDGDGVSWLERAVPAIDPGALLARAEAAIWASRATRAEVA